MFGYERASSNEVKFIYRSLEKVLYQEKVTLTLKQTSKGYTTAVTG